MTAPVENESSDVAESGTSDLSESVLRGAIPPQAVLLGLLIGSAIACFVHVLFTGLAGASVMPLRVAETLELSDADIPAAPPRAELGSEEVTLETEAEARKALAEARDAVKRLEGRKAVAAFSECIELADLPKCHLELGLLLLTMGDGAAYPHLERYLELDPQPEEADALGVLLDRVRTSTAP